MDVYVEGDRGDAACVVCLGTEVQRGFHFSVTPTMGAVTLRLAEGGDGAPFHVDRLGGVTVSTCQSAGISRYAGIPREAYLLTVGMLGLVQWRALLRNPLLVAEDFLHDSPCACLFERHLFVEEYALVFEEPRLCRYCGHFYESLCTPVEMDALRDTIAHVAGLAVRAA